MSHKSNSSPNHGKSSSGRKSSSHKSLETLKRSGSKSKTAEVKRSSSLPRSKSQSHHSSKSQSKSTLFSSSKSQSQSASSMGPMHIGNLAKLHWLQKSVVKSRIVSSSSSNDGSGKSGVHKLGVKSGIHKSITPRERIDPRTVKHNDNIPVEASAAHVAEKKESSVLVAPGGTQAYIDSALLPVNLYNSDVRFEFQASVMNSLVGTLCDPNKFLKPVSAAASNGSYLDRHVDPHKLINFIVHHMKVYYDLSADPDAYSHRRQEMDNHLWDNLAFVIPMLCRQVIDIVEKEPMIVTDVEPDVIVFGDIHGNFNDIHYIYNHIIINPEYAKTRFIFLGDYVDRGPKPVEVVSLLFALKLAEPKRFILLRGNHEVLKINRKYGFQHMCCHIFLDTYVARPTLAELIYKSFNRAFCYLPVAAIIKGSSSSSGSKSGSQTSSGSKSGSKSGSSHGGKSIFCCHGGVPAYSKEEGSRSKSKSGSKSGSKSEAEGDWTISALNSAFKKPASLEPSSHGPPAEHAFNEILWNDPIPARLRDPAKYPRKFYINKKRGGHCSFFTEAGLRAFLDINGLSMVIRGHQYRHSMATGYNYDFDGALLTVFSSSNYCGTEENATGYVHVKGPECHVTPHTLRTIEEAEKYRSFNVLKIQVDENTQEVTHVSF